MATALVAVHIPKLQGKLVTMGIKALNDDFKTNITLKSVDIDFFGDINLYGIAAKDGHNLDFINIRRAKIGLDLLELIKDYNHVIINQVTIYEPDIKVITYKGEDNDNFDIFIDKFDDPKQTKPSKFTMKSVFDLVNASVSIVNQNTKEDNGVWLETHDLNGRIINFKQKHGLILADGQNLSMTAKRNNRVSVLKNLTASFSFTNTLMSFEGVTFETNTSLLKGSLKFKYKKKKDFADFNNAINWDLDLKPSSYVGFNDVRYFRPDWTKNNTLKIDGNVTGVMNSLWLNNATLSHNSTYLYAKKLNLINIIHSNYAIDAKKIRLQASRQSLEDFLPTAIGKKISPYVTKFGTLNYTGDFAINPNDLQLNGNAKTKIGTADIYAKILGYTTKGVKYSGRIITPNIDLAQLTNQKNLGNVSGDIRFVGSSFDLNQLKLQTNSTLKYIDILGKRFNNLVVNGKLIDKKFDGHFGLNDKVLKMTYDGVFDFKTPKYKLNFISNIAYANLNYFNIGKENNAKITTKAKGNFTFSDLNDFVGNAKLSQVEYKSDKRELNFDEISLNSLINSDGTKAINLDLPNKLQAGISGDFNVYQLPKIMENAFGSLTNGYKKVSVAKNQFALFDVHVADPSLVEIFKPELIIAPSSHISGSVNTDNNQLILNANTKLINYDGVLIYGSSLKIDSKALDKPTDAQFDSVTVKGYTIRNIFIKSKLKNDSLYVSSIFETGTKDRQKFKLNFHQTFSKDKKDMFIGFSPSEININNRVWYLNEKADSLNKINAIVNFKKGVYSVKNIRLESEGQQVEFTGNYTNNKNYNANVVLHDVSLEKIIPQDLLGSMKIKGIANGTASITKTRQEIKPISNLKISGIEVNNYSIGNLGLDAQYISAEDKFGINAELERDNLKSLIISGFINNKTEQPTLDLNAKFNDLNLNFIGGFMTSVLKNFRGTASGDINLTGNYKDPDYSGSVFAKNLGFTVGFLGADYEFNGEKELTVTKGVILLDNLDFIDTVFKTRANVAGLILFDQTFTNWGLELDFDTKNLLVLNTNQSMNDTFYGRIFGKGGFNIYGSVENLTISANAATTRNSHLTINTGNPPTISDNNLVKFVINKPSVKSTTDSIQLKKEQKKSASGITIDLNIDINPQAEMTLVFDELSGDMINARGSAKNLKLKMNKLGDINMNGTYEIKEGVYKFRRIPVINKDFSLKNKSVIRWDESPYDADLKIDAVYSKSVSNIADYLNSGYSQTVDTDLIIHIADKLSKPSIEFGLQIPTASDQLRQQLSAKLSSQDEINYQFGSILLTSKFLANSNSISNTVTSSAYEIALKQLSTILSSISKKVGFNFEYTKGDLLSQTSDRLKSSSYVNLTKRIKAIGTVGLPIQSAYNEVITGEAELQYDLTKETDGSLVLRNFTRPTTLGIENFNNSDFSTQSYGLGILFRKSFNNVKELLEKQKIDDAIVDDTKNKKKPQPTPTLPLTPPNTPPAKQEAIEPKPIVIPNQQKDLIKWK